MANYTIEYFENNDEWLSARGIGGSDLASILGKSKWASADDVYNRLVLGKTKKIKTNERMQEGINAEPHIRALFALDLGSDWEMITPPEKGWLFRRKDYPLMTYTPDGLLIYKKGELKMIYEAKDIELRYKRKSDNDWENGIIPTQYYCQLLQGEIVIDDYDGSIINAHIKHYKYSDYFKDWVFDYAEDKNYWLFRDEITNELKAVENKEIDFIVNNIQKKQRPKMSIKL